MAVIHIETSLLSMFLSLLLHSDTCLSRPSQSKDLFLYFQKTNMTLKVSSSVAYECFSVVAYMGFIFTDWWIQPPQSPFFPRRLLSSLIHFTHCYWGTSQPVADHIYSKKYRPGQGLNHDLIRLNREWIKNRSNIISWLDNCIIMVTHLQHWQHKWKPTLVKSLRVASVLSPAGGAWLCESRPDPSHRSPGFRSSQTRKM